MAQKAAKATAKRNSEILNRMHLIAIAINLFYLLLRLAIFRASTTTKSLLVYVLLSAPAFVVEAVFEINSRPKYNSSASNDLRSSGEDLEAKGLTEWMWDVLYWTWGCIVLAAVVGDYAWWLYVVVPLYSAWLAYSTFGNLRSAMGMPSDAGQAEGAASGSKRQQKLEKRGGQRVQYR